MGGILLRELSEGNLEREGEFSVLKKASPILVQKSVEKVIENSLKIDLASIGKAVEKFEEFIFDKKISNYEEVHFYDGELRNVLMDLKYEKNQNLELIKKVNLKDSELTISYIPEEDDFYIEILNLNSGKKSFRVLVEIKTGEAFYAQIRSAFDEVMKKDEKAVFLSSVKEIENVPRCAEV